MAHKHSVSDTDLHFIINPVTRQITPQDSKKNTIIQYDHNSEELTFSCPRWVDNHDMSLSDKIEIHFINVSGSNVNKGVYPVKNVELNEDGDTLTFSWLIANSATMFSGKLNFVVKFKCLTGDVIDYEWNTAVYGGLSVSQGFNNSDDVVSNYVDVLEAWKAEIIEAVGSGVVSRVEPAEDDIPKVFITGVKPTTKDDVLAEMQYISKTDNFHAYLEIKCQGTSSMSYTKKNFTIKMFSDEERETKLKKSFKDWRHNGNKYVLKANYIDHSHARNIVSARLWGEVVASRPDYNTLPEEMRNSPNNGAVDGFPIKVYYNGNYEGIYTWNIGKDDCMWNMDKNNPNHILLCAEGNTDGVYAETTSNFRALWNGVDGGKPGWSVEVGTNSNAVKTSLNNLIQFVMDNNGSDFRNGIGNYLDIQSAIDYYIFQYEICGIDGLAHNMLLGTFDGTIWHCGAYDMDSTFGLWWTGGSYVSAEYACPEDYQEKFSLLWERIETNYVDELKTRQAELRKTVLSYSNMVTHFERFMDIIGLDLYAEDLTIYPDIPSGVTNNIKQIRKYIRDRQAYVDAEFNNMVKPIICTSITLNRTEYTFTDEKPITLTATVLPNNSTEKIVWESDDTSVAIVTNGVVTPLKNGSCRITVTCGSCSDTCSITVNANDLISYSVTNNLTNFTNSNSDTVVKYDTTYSARLTPNIGCVVESVVITMGGVDITSSAYVNGIVTISNVVGDIIITAIANIDSSIIYKLDEPSSGYFNTGVSLMSEDSSHTVAFTVYFTANSTEVMTIATEYYLRAVAYVRFNLVFGGAAKDICTMGDISKTNTPERIKFVITHEKDTNEATCYILMNGEVYSQTVTASNTSYINATTLSFGINGTVEDLTIYSRVWANDEINTYLV